MVDHLDVSMMCVGCSFRFRMRFSCCHQRLLCIAVDDFPVGFGPGDMVDDNQDVHYLDVDDLDVDYLDVDDLGDSLVELVVVDVAR